MNEEQLLRAALPPVKDLEPGRDLWPAMRRKIDQHTIRMPIWDWALIAAIENAVYFALSVWFFQYMYRRSRETGQFARNEE